MKQASGEGASSETIQKASEAVFGAAVNCMLSVDTPQNDEQVRQGGDILGTITTMGIMG